MLVSRSPPCPVGKFVEEKERWVLGLHVRRRNGDGLRSRLVHLGDGLRSRLVTPFLDVVGIPNLV